MSESHHRGPTRLVSALASFLTDFQVGYNNFKVKYSDLESAGPGMFTKGSLS